ASCRRYSSSSPPVSAPPPRYRRESSPMAPVDRLLRADRLSQTVPPAACPHQRTPVAPSWPPRIIAVTSEIRTGQRQELFFEAPPSHCGILLRLVERLGDQHGTDFDQPRYRGAWWCWRR